MSALCAGEREDRRAYVQALADYARDDARQVYIRVTAALAVTALFVTQVPLRNLQELNDRWTVVLFAGLICLVAAAFLYFLYVAASHHARREIATFLLNLEQVHPYEAGEDAVPTKPGDDHERHFASVLSTRSRGKEPHNPADRVLTDLWRSHRVWAFHTPDALFALGVLLLGLVLAKLIWGPVVPTAGG